MRVSVLAASCLALLTANAKAAGPQPRLRTANGSGLAIGAGSDASSPFPSGYCESLWSDFEETESSKLPLPLRGDFDAKPSLETCVLQTRSLGEGKQPVRLGAGAYGVVYLVEGGGGEKRAVKCMHRDNNKPRKEACAAVQANKAEPRVGPVLYDAWACSAPPPAPPAEGEAKRPVRDTAVSCYEMEFVAGANEDINQSQLKELMQSDPAAAARYQEDVFSLVKRALDRGVMHNDLHPGNVGRLASGELLLFDWGQAEVCRSTVPPMLQPLSFLSEYRTWAMVVGFLLVGTSDAASKAMDLDGNLIRMLEGTHPLFKQELHITPLAAGPSELPDVTALLQAEIAAKPGRHGIEALDSEWEAGWLLGRLVLSLAKTGRNMYLTNKAELTLEQVGEEPVRVTAWRVEGRMHQWAADVKGAAAALEEMKREECPKAAKWHEMRMLSLWGVSDSHPNAKTKYTVTRQEGSELQRMHVTFELDMNAPPSLQHRASWLSGSKQGDDERLKALAARFVHAQGAVEELVM